MTEAYFKLKRDLRCAGISLRAIARDAGVSHTAVTDVARGARRSKRIEEIIALRPGTEPSHLWPDRYSRKGGAT